MRTNFTQNLCCCFISNISKIKRPLLIAILSLSFLMSSAQSIDPCTADIILSDPLELDPETNTIVYGVLDGVPFTITSPTNLNFRQLSPGDKSNLINEGDDIVDENGNPVFTDDEINYLVETNYVSNALQTTRTITFDEPIVDPAFFLYSIGKFGQPRTVTFSSDEGDGTGGLISPIEVVAKDPDIFSNNIPVTYVVNENSITVNEGRAIIKLPGSYTSISFDYGELNGGVAFFYFGKVIDNCIVDSDGDGIADEVDNCPDTANADQADADGDLVGDICDDTPNGDDDNDGVDNAVDVCPGSDDTIDTDQDGAPDGCDDTPNGDDDNDGVDNAVDVCPGSDDTIDTDQDGTPDGCDETPNGDDDNGNGNGETVTICHIPPGNPNNPQTITVSVNALQAHLNHGDALGECEIEDNEPTEGCYAAEVIAFEQGQNSNGNAVAANRGDATTALGEPDRSNAAGGFVSLGINGYLTLQFAGAVYNADGDDIMIYETSFSGDDCSGASDERAMVEVSQDGATWFNAGEICRDGGIDLQGIPVVYVTHIRITDVTTGSGDGFDVDGVEILSGCQNTPDEENDVCYGAFVVENSYTPGPKKNGQAITDPSRLDPSKALGEPEGDDSFNFVSLGYGGEITIGFDGAVLNQSGADLEVVETTFGSQDFDSYAESADVYVSQDGTNFFMIGSVMTDESASLDISNASVYLSYITHVKLVDTTPVNSVSTDGFDLAGIVALPGCTPLNVTEGSATDLSESAALSTSVQTFANIEVKMYPVPARDILNVKLQNYAGGAASYEIVSLMGQTFIKGSLKAASEFNADVSNLSDGAYFLLIHVNGKTINKKFIKATK